MRKVSKVKKSSGSTKSTKSNNMKSMGKAKKVLKRAPIPKDKTGVAYRPLQLGNAPLSQRGGD